MKRTLRRFGAPLHALLLALPVLLVASTAHAGGFYLTDRGTRPLGRGHAYVAGADDPQALWYNPAGIGWSGKQILFDSTLTLLDAEYTRVDSGGNVLPTVEASPAPLPVPMIAYTDDFGLDEWTFGLGVLAPNAALLEWPGSVQMDGMSAPAPQRYSLLTMEGTVLAHLVAGVAWRPIPELSIGLAPQLVIGSFNAQVAVSACDGVVCSQPENPEWDGLAQIDIFPIIRPAASAGVTYDAGFLRVGASFMAPFNVGGSGEFRVRLPEAALFDGATVEGNQIEGKIKFPWIFRAGVEVRPVEELRIETALVIEGWSRQERISLTPQDVWIRDATGIGDYQVGPVDIERNMKNVYSVRLGGSYALADGRVVLSTGASWENGAFDDPYLTPLTLDTDKFLVSLGASVEVSDGIWIDASYGHVFMRDRNVTNSQVLQTNPIRPPRTGDTPTEGGPVPVGNGQYAMKANIFGLGLRWQLDTQDPPTPPPEG